MSLSLSSVFLSHSIACFQCFTVKSVSPELSAQSLAMVSHL